jgi:hypothetical protein
MPNHIRDLSDIINDANNVHKDIYEYESIERIQKGTKTVIYLNIKCAEHGCFRKSLDNHVKKDARLSCL